MRLTYGQLVDAANVARHERWDHTSMELALTYNVNRAEGQRPTTPDDWHPLKRTKRKKRQSSFTAADARAAHDAIAKVKPVKYLTGQVIDNDDY